MKIQVLIIKVKLDVSSPECDNVWLDSLIRFCLFVLTMLYDYDMEWCSYYFGPKDLIAGVFF